jgi:hypothetical protein
LERGEIIVNGNDWPMFVYAGEEFDPNDPWKGLFQGHILVMVSDYITLKTPFELALQAFKHIFTSPSSVDKEPKATRSGNARIHGMTRVSKASIAYVATQVQSFSSFD